MSIVQLLINAAKAVGSIVYEDLVEEQKLVALDPEANDEFGSSGAISGDGSRAIVGAWKEDALGSLSGSAYVFSRSGTTWTQEQKLTASDGDAGDSFGFSAAISDDGSRVIVGAFTEDGAGTQRGAAYVLSRSGTTWTQEQKLTASDTANDNHFGYSVAMSGDGTRCIVGAKGKINVGQSGSAYVFSRSGTTWTEEDKLTASDGQANDYFGQSVAISDDGFRCIVGAHNEDGAGTDRGAAYVFSRSGTTWTQEQKLTASDTQDNDIFGTSVTISSNGTRCIVGASTANAAYVFSRSGTTWTEEEILISSDSQTGDAFGDSVSMSDDGSRCIVGAWHEDGGAGDPLQIAGAAYVFSRSGTTWTEEQKLTSSDLQAYDHFGDRVSMSSNGSRCIICADWEDGGAGDPLQAAGAAYVFSTP